MPFSARQNTVEENNGRDQRRCLMQLLVLNDICGRADSLQAVLALANTSDLAAIIVLGNIVAAPRRREAHVFQQQHQLLPEDLKAALIHETADDRQTYHTIASVL